MILVEVNDRGNKEGLSNVFQLCVPSCFHSSLVGASMMDALSLCVLERQPANDYRALARPSFPLFCVTVVCRVSPVMTPPFAGLINELKPTGRSPGVR